MLSLSVYKIIFMAELLVAEFLFALPLKKRPHFAWRFACVSAVCLTAAVFFPVLQYNAFYASMLFLVLFLVSIGGLMFCYREKSMNIVYSAVAAYTVRHLSFQLFSLYLTLAGGSLSVNNLYGSATGEFVWDASFALTVFAFVGCYFVVYALGYTIFGHRIGNSENFAIRRPYLLIIVIIILFVDIVLNAVVVYNSPPENFNDALVYYVNIVTSYIYNILCCLFMLFIQFSMIDRQKLKKELEIVSHLWKQEREQYEISKENIDLINLKCHDLKYQIRQLATGDSLNMKTVGEIESLISIYDSMFKTGNEALDVIFTEKSLVCNKNNIKLNCMMDGSGLSFMDKADIYVLFGNLMDNAMEAVQKLDDIDKRVIAMNVQAQDKLLAVNMSNYYSGDVVLRPDGLPSTTKGDDKFHGFGMKSIRMIVEQYGGNIDFSAEGGIFSIDIIFPIRGQN